MGSAASAVQEKRTKPDVKGHRQWLVANLKPKVRGIPVTWSLTQKRFDGIKFTPWGIMEKVEMGVQSDWLAGRKVKINMGNLENLLTDHVLEFDMGGNKELTGAVGVLQACTFITAIDLHSCPVHGDINVFAVLGSLESLSLGDTNVGGNLESLSPVTTLVSLNLRYTKTCGDLKVTAAFPSLERLDLTGVSKITGSIEVLGFLQDLAEIRLQQTSVTGDVGCFDELSALTAVDISRTKLEGDIKVFEVATGLTHLSCVDTEVDCDALGSLKGTLKDCDIKVSI